MLKQILTTGKLFMLSVVLMVASCTKDAGKHDYPNSFDRSRPDGVDTITVGQQIRLDPSFTGTFGATMQWTVDSNVVSNDAEYVFAPSEAGDYVVAFFATNPQGATRFVYNIHVRNKYENGFYIINEGQFGQTKGSVNFYHYGADTVDLNVFEKENPGRELGTTSQFGALHNDRLYIVSKQGPLVVTDAKSMRETGRIATLPADARAFVIRDNSSALLSTADGIYPVNLSTLAVGGKLANINGETGNMHIEGNHLFALNQAQGVVVVDLATNTVELTIPDLTQGLVKSAGGKIWVAGGTSLVGIDPATLDTVHTTLPFDVADPWGSWNAGTITASTKDEAVYVAKTEPWGAGGSELYKYVPGNAASLNAPFVTLPSGKEFYGGGVRYNAVKDEITVTAVQSGYGVNYSFNSLYFFDVASGSMKDVITYEGYFFPALTVF